MAVVWSWKFNGNKDTGNVAFDATDDLKDEYWQRLLKAVPVAGVGFVTVAGAFANAAPADQLKLALGVVLIVGLGFAYLEMTRQRKVTGNELWIALGAYLVWSYANGGFFVAMGWWSPWVAGVLAAAYAGALRFFPAPTK